MALFIIFFIVMVLLAFVVVAAGVCVGILLAEEIKQEACK